MLAVKSMSEFIDLSIAHAHNQFETMTAQTNELAALAQKITSDITEPLKTGVSKSFNGSLARVLEKNGGANSSVDQQG